VAIALSVAVPGIVRTLITGVSLRDPGQYNTALAIIAAILAGFYTFKKINVFPGISSGGYMATSLTLSFALAGAVLLFLRLPYTTIQLFAGYVVATAFLVMLHVVVVSRREIVLGFVPSVAPERLPHNQRVRWFPIMTPDASLPTIDGVVVDLNADHSDAWSNRIAAFVLDGIPVYHVKAAIENLVGQVEIEHLSENTLGSLNPNDFYLGVKNLVDRLAAALLLAALSPVFAVIAIAIKIDTPGPVFYRQGRAGFRKRQFSIIKFRTMLHAQHGTDARLSAITIANDPRITRVGRFLRKTRLDELPQLMNVARGEMSLIGPRPEALPLVEWYEKEIPFYHYRHIIKPGITGWAQVNQGHVSEMVDVTRKLHLDFYYVKNFSFWLDIYIALKTVRVIIRGVGAK
jgi:exopolysaccharide biosynthesis polyprenyl glycosylphosphotransferase